VTLSPPPQERRREMKDFIVIIATIILGVFLALIILKFKTKATTMETSVNTAIGGLDLTVPTT